jgi:hypothetical protein
MKLFIRHLCKKICFKHFLEKALFRKALFRKKCGKNLAKIWQKFGKKCGKNLAKIWQKFDTS